MMMRNIRHVSQLSASIGVHYGKHLLDILFTRRQVLSIVVWHIYGYLWRWKGSRQDFINIYHIGIYVYRSILNMVAVQVKFNISQNTIMLLTCLFQFYLLLYVFFNC